MGSDFGREIGDAMVFFAGIAFIAIGAGAGFAIDVGLALSPASRWWLLAPPLIGAVAGFKLRRAILPD